MKSESKVDKKSSIEQSALINEIIIIIMMILKIISTNNMTLKIS